MSDEVAIYVGDTRQQFGEQFTKAFECLFVDVLTDDERKAALAAAEAEFRNPKWSGRVDWAEPMAAVIWAALEGLDAFRKM